MKRLAVTADDGLLDAFTEAGIALWHDQFDLVPGDSLFIGSDMATPAMIQSTGTIAIPGVTVFIVTADADDASIWERAQAIGAHGVVLLPEGLPYLCKFVSVIEVAGVAGGPTTPRAVTLSLAVTTGEPGLVVPHVPPDEGHTRRDRLRAGLVNAGFPWPELQMTLTWRDHKVLRPGWGDQPTLAVPYQSGAELDLALAAAVLAASEVVPVGSLLGRVFIGEAGLDGRVRPVRDLSSMLTAMPAAGLSRAVVPASELVADAPAGLVLEPVADLAEVVALLRR